MPKKMDRQRHALEGRVGEAFDTIAKKELILEKWRVPKMRQMQKLTEDNANLKSEVESAQKAFAEAEETVEGA